VAELIYRGAEAEVFRTKILGITAIEKRRISKGYRCRELDEKIRARRTRLEASLLQSAKKAGIRAPAMLRVDSQENAIFMEFIPGKKARNLGKSGREWASMGKSIGMLHRNNIIHGDLTTRNIIVAEGDNIAFVDFGLGFYSAKTEDKAFDMLNLKKILFAEDDAAGKKWKKILQGYSKEFPKAGAVIKRIARGESRGRYT